MIMDVFGVIDLNKKKTGRSLWKLDIFIQFWYTNILLKLEMLFTVYS